MNVLVIGGTRFIGPSAVRRLEEAGHDVTLFHRGRTFGGALDGVRKIIGDRRPLGRHADELRETKPDILLDMIAITELDAHEVMGGFPGVAKCGLWRERQSAIPCS